MSDQLLVELEGCGILIVFFVKYLNPFFWEDQNFLGKIDVKIEVKINLKDLDHHDYAKQIVAAL